jgi:spoIIIJ-associated protein
MSEKTLEIEDKSIDEAIEKACREFGVPREKLNIEIISEDTGGFLGMLSKKAKIRASLLSLDIEFALNGNSETKNEARIKIEPRIKPEKPVVSAVSNSNSMLASQAKELLAGILQRMSFESQVTTNETSERIILNIEGDDSGLLIGRRGQNLDALQYIVNKAINKSDSERKMIMIDSEAYRKRREESLLSLAEKIRDRVKKTRKPVSLSHMNAHDRRIIHLALQEDETLMTKSRGEGEYRKIVILPAKKGSTNHTIAKKQE